MNREDIRKLEAESLRLGDCFAAAICRKALGSRTDDISGALTAGEARTVATMTTDDARGWCQRHVNAKAGGR